jgi:hypothetical protein
MAYDDLDEEYYQNRANDDLDVAGDWSKVPLVGEGMAAGEFAKARQNQGKAAERIISGVDLPEFLQGDYGQYSLAGTYDPQMAQASQISEDPRLREMEMAALNRLSGNLDAASTSKGDAARFAALDEGNQLARAREGEIRAQAERSGQAGSGMDALMQAQAAQMGANRARQGTMDALHQKALERLANEQALTSAAGNMRGEDFRANSANANIINQFGMFNTQAANEAKRMNLQAQQGINNANVEQGNRSLDRADRNAQQMFGNQMQVAGGRANALQGMSAATGDAQKAGAAANQRATDTAKDTIAGIYSMFSGGGS